MKYMSFAILCRYWRCYPRSDHCTVRMQTTLHMEARDETNLSTPQIIVAPHNHEHPPPLGYAERCHMVSDMRQRVKVDSQTQLNITYESVVVQRSMDVDKAVAPSYYSVKSILKRQRRARVPNLPTTVEDVQLEGEWKTTLTNELFLLLDEPNRTDVIFTCATNLKCLAQCKTWYVDGTFATCPSPFV